MGSVLLAHNLDFETHLGEFKLSWHLMGGLVEESMLVVE